MTLKPSAFFIGQQVQMTQKAIQQRLDGTLKRRVGVVKGVVPACGINFLRVKRDGERSASTYHPSFWEPASEQAIADNGKYCRACGQRLP